MGEIKVFLNPADYIFQDCLHYGYVMAASLPDVEKLKQFKFPEQTIRSNKNIIIIIKKKIKILISHLMHQK